MVYALCGSKLNLLRHARPYPCMKELTSTVEAGRHRNPIHRVTSSTCDAAAIYMGTDAGTKLMTSTPTKTSQVSRCIRANQKLLQVLLSQKDPRPSLAVCFALRIHVFYKGSARCAASTVLSKLALNANLWPGLYLSTVLMIPSKYGVCLGTIRIPSYRQSTCQYILNVHHLSIT